jgi:tRNA threonylcarbamoyladenosine modification (KEOPS) complex Cgi121 subunit
MLYVSAQRQITKAIAKVGVKPHSVNVVAIILSENAGLAESGFEAITKMLGAPPDESVLELSERKINRLRRVFEISDEELEAVSSKGDEKQAITELIIERVALLSTKL